MSPLTDQELYLFNEGTHFRIYDVLGAHPRTVDGRDAEDLTASRACR